MTTKQFSQALALARSKEGLSNVDDSILDGCALPNFRPVYITLRIAAKFIRWHAICLNGEVDGEALNEIKTMSKKWLLV